MKKNNKISEMSALTKKKHMDVIKKVNVNNAVFLNKHNENRQLMIKNNKAIDILKTQIEEKKQNHNIENKNNIEPSEIYQLIKKIKDLDKKKAENICVPTKWIGVVSQIMKTDSNKRAVESLKTRFASERYPSDENNNVENKIYKRRHTIIKRSKDEIRKENINVIDYKSTNDTPKFGSNKEPQQELVNMDELRKSEFSFKDYLYL